jgi:protein-disulfide isomerase
MATKLGTWGISTIVGLALAQTVAAQSANDVQTLGKEIEALKAGQTAIQKELQEIKSLLQAAPAAAQARAAAPAARTPAPPETTNAVFSIGDAPSKGVDNAKVTLLEFTDYQCPFCSRHFQQTWPQLEKDYVVTGKVKLVIRDMPLAAIHPQAFKAAEATYCAGEQGKFWDMHDRLFANQSALARKDLTAHAQAVGLDVGAFDKCMDTDKGAAKIRKDVADSEKAGAKGTPIFFLGLTEPNSSELKAVRVIRGAHPYSAFKEAIDSLLASAK